jgi:hypothetical protein
MIARRALARIRSKARRAIDQRARSGEGLEKPLRRIDSYLCQTTGLLTDGRQTTGRPAERLNQIVKIRIDVGFQPRPDQ